MTKYKAGDKVTIHVEGVVAEDFDGETNKDNTVKIFTENNGWVYVDTQDLLHPFLTVEPKPLPDGLYTWKGRVGEITAVLRHNYGNWYDSDLRKVEAPDPDDIVRLRAEEL